MKILVACEFSGIVREAFAARGHDAWSCDLLETEQPGQHLQCDVREVLGQRWDMMIAFPPCTYLCRSGARWWNERRQEQQEALDFVQALWNAPIARIAIENPIGHLSSAWSRPTQIIQPWMFGVGETKATCLWLKGLPPLLATEIAPGRKPAIHMAPDSKNRSRNRSRTYSCIASAMAAQWL